MFRTFQTVLNRSNGNFGRHPMSERNFEIARESKKTRNFANWNKTCNKITAEHILRFQSQIAQLRKKFRSLTQF